MRKFDNPEYIDDDEGYKFDEVGCIGFDAWQVNGGTIFDDIIITDNKAEADNFAKKWKAFSEVEEVRLPPFRTGLRASVIQCPKKCFVLVFQACVNFVVAVSCLSC